MAHFSNHGTPKRNLGGSQRDCTEARSRSHHGGTDAGSSRRPHSPIQWWTEQRHFCHVMPADNTTLANMDSTKYSYQLFVRPGADSTDDLRASQMTSRSAHYDVKRVSLDRPFSTRDPECRLHQGDKQWTLLPHDSRDDWVGTDKTCNNSHGAEKQPMTQLNPFAPNNDQNSASAAHSNTTCTSSEARSSRSNSASSCSSANGNGFSRREDFDGNNNSNNNNNNNTNTYTFNINSDNNMEHDLLNDGSIKSIPKKKDGSSSDCNVSVNTAKFNASSKAFYENKNTNNNISTSGNIAKTKTCIDKFLSREESSHTTENNNQNYNYYNHQPEYEKVVTNRDNHDRRQRCNSVPVQRGFGQITYSDAPVSHVGQRNGNCLSGSPFPSTEGVRSAKYNEFMPQLGLPSAIRDPKIAPAHCMKKIGPECSNGGSQRCQYQPENSAFISNNEEDWVEKKNQWGVYVSPLSRTPLQRSSNTFKIKAGRPSPVLSSTDTPSSRGIRSGSCPNKAIGEVRCRSGFSNLYASSPPQRSLQTTPACVSGSPIMSAECGPATPTTPDGSARTLDLSSDGTYKVIGGRPTASASTCKFTPGYGTYKIIGGRQFRDPPEQDPRDKMELPRHLSEYKAYQQQCPCPRMGRYDRSDAENQMMLPAHKSTTLIKASPSPFTYMRNPKIRRS